MLPLFNFLVLVSIFISQIFVYLTRNSINAIWIRMTCIKISQANHMGNLSVLVGFNPHIQHLFAYFHYLT